MNSNATISTGQQPRPLATLATEINEHHRAAQAALQSGPEHGLAAGRLLLEAKAQCSHGTWGKWLADNFEGSSRTAQCYMRVANRWPELEAKAQATADLTLDGAVKLLAAPKRLTDEEVFRQVAELRERLEGVDAITDREKQLRASLEIIDEAEALVAHIHEQRFVESGAHERLAKNGKIYTRDLYRAPRAYLPRLSPEYIFRGSISPEACVEIRPSIKHPGYYRVATYHNIGTDHAEVEYDVRPVKYTKALLKRRLRGAGCKRVSLWVRVEHDGQEWSPCCGPEEANAA